MNEAELNGILGKIRDAYLNGVDEAKLNADVAVASDELMPPELVERMAVFAAAQLIHEYEHLASLHAIFKELHERAD
jgi:hypothetical protein